MRPTSPVTDDHLAGRFHRPSDPRARPSRCASGRHLGPQGGRLPRDRRARRPPRGMGTQPEYDFPFPISINTDQIGGPSAGLAWTLGHPQHPVRWSSDRRASPSPPAAPSVPTAASATSVAWQQKTVAVERAGATVFFVPDYADSSSTLARSKATAEPQGLRGGLAGPGPDGSPSTWAGSWGRRRQGPPAGPRRPQRAHRLAGFPVVLSGRPANGPFTPPARRVVGSRPCQRTAAHDLDVVPPPSRRGRPAHLRHRPPGLRPGRSPGLPRTDRPRDADAGRPGAGAARASWTKPSAGPPTPFSTRPPSPPHSGQRRLGSCARPTMRPPIWWPRPKPRPRRGPRPRTRPQLQPRPNRTPPTARPKPRPSPPTSAAAPRRRPRPSSTGSKLEAEELVAQARAECRAMVQEAQEVRARVPGRPDPSPPGAAQPDRAVAGRSRASGRDHQRRPPDRRPASPTSCSGPRTRPAWRRRRPAARPRQGEPTT